MPRDLNLEQQQQQEERSTTPGSPPTLSESPNRMSGPSSPEPDQQRESSRSFTIIPSDQQYQPTANLHPLVRPLTISDLESVVALENSAFTDEADRATREKVCFVLFSFGGLVGLEVVEDIPFL